MPEACTHCQLAVQYSHLDSVGASVIRAIHRGRVASLSGAIALEAREKFEFSFLASDVPHTSNLLAFGGPEKLGTHDSFE